MISIIICSRSPQIDQQLADNIDRTIGVPYEILNIDNSENRYSIFQAYNSGVTQSKYPILCFMHDDIHYHTLYWGRNIVKHFEDEHTAAIGIAGSPYYSKMPGSWWSGGLVNEVIIHGTSADLTPSIKRVRSGDVVKDQVVLIDGVWMCIRKSLFSSIKFDEASFKGFHFYDIDISFQINKLGYKLYVVFDTVIQHFSVGNMNENWVENDVTLRRKWSANLPLQCIKLSFADVCETELRTFDEYLDILIYHKKPKKEIYKLLAKSLSRSYKLFFYHRTLYYLTKYFKKLAG